MFACCPFFLKTLQNLNSALSTLECDQDNKSVRLRQAAIAINLFYTLHCILHMVVYALYSLLFFSIHIFSYAYCSFTSIFVSFLMHFIFYTLFCVFQPMHHVLCIMFTASCYVHLLLCIRLYVYTIHSSNDITSCKLAFNFDHMIP